jgi:gas vesicle protein
MRITRNDLFEALGMRESGMGDWIAPGLIGFGVGALVGASLALLVAPRAGSELREALLSRGRRVVQRGREDLSEAVDEMAHRPGSREH